MSVIIDLPLSRRTGMHDTPLAVVRAELIEVPHLAEVATFAVHLDVGGFCEWAVSNIETGYCIERGYTKRHAVKTALQTLLSKTVAEVVERMNLAEEHGLKQAKLREEYGQ